MKKLNCMAIDDEPHALLILKEYASKVPFLEMVATFQSPLEALPYLEANPVDVLFLDIQMPELSGLQFLSILKQTPEVILTTAYSEFALEGYEYNVTDYLLKPYSFERFLKAVQKVNRETEPKPVPIVIETVAPENQDSIFIKGDAKNKFHRLEIDNILFIEGMRNYVSINLKEGKKVITLQNMKSLEETLAGNGFIRIHKSYLINMKMIHLVDGNTVSIGDQSLPIGGSYRKLFFEKIGK